MDHRLDGLPGRAEVRFPASPGGRARPDYAREFVGPNDDGSGLGVEPLRIRSTAVADYGAGAGKPDPKNKAKLDALGDALAAAALNWVVGASYDLVNHGILSPAPTGFADEITWTYRDGDASTRYTSPIEPDVTPYNLSGDWDVSKLPARGFAMLRSEPTSGAYRAVIALDDADDLADPGPTAHEFDAIEVNKLTGLTGKYVWVEKSPSGMYRFRFKRGVGGTPPVQGGIIIQIRTCDGLPVPGQAVMVVNSFGGLVASGTTGADGNATFVGISLGTFYTSGGLVGYIGPGTVTVTDVTSFVTVTYVPIFSLEWTFFGTQSSGSSGIPWTLTGTSPGFSTVTGTSPPLFLGQSVLYQTANVAFTTANAGTYTLTTPAAYVGSVLTLTVSCPSATSAPFNLGSVGY